MTNLFYRPQIGVSGDYIPWYKDGTFYLFYLQDFRDKAGHGEGTPWYLITTRDFVRFEEHGQVLPRGAREDQDLYVFTGSVAEYGGKYHIWYTGHNPCFPDKGRPLQAVMHAVSEDLYHWVKMPGDTFCAPKDQYERDDWRDPFVYPDGRGGYRMLLAARAPHGPDRRRGVTAACVCEDGVHWRPTEPFWAPELYYTHECPDLFRMGDWYYLLFSEFSQEKVTRYRMSRSPEGPWLRPRDDRFDGCAYYAAKTAASGDRRYLFGWLATREGDSDEGAWQWGGCLVTHELVQRGDGTLGVRLPETVRGAFAEAPAEEALLDGGRRMDRRICGELKDVCLLDLWVRDEDAKGSFSVALFADEALDEGAFIRLDFDRNRMTFDRWPRDACRGFEPGLERPMPPRSDDGTHLQILIDGTAGCAYLNDGIALCFRIYQRKGRFWGLQAEDAKARVRYRALGPA